MRVGSPLKSAFVITLLAILLPAFPGFGHVLPKSDKATIVDTTGGEEQVAPDVLAGVPSAVLTKGPKKILHVVLVDKSKQRLYLYLYRTDGEINLVRSFPCSTGKAIGDKIKEGDRRTPEGVYFFTKAYYDNKVTIFGTTAFHLNYPDPFDTAEGKEGNGIYLHGTNRPLGSRDTNGCVVMNNRDLDFIRQRIEIHDTPIVISPKLTWISMEKLEQDRREFAAALQANWQTWSGSIVDQIPEGSTYDLEHAVLLRQNGRTLIRTPVMVEEKLGGWRNIYLSDFRKGETVLASLWMARGQRLSVPRPVEADQLSEERLLAFLQGWVKAWESRDVNEYMSYYSRRFRAYGMNYRQWRAYKRSLARKYRAIDVEINAIRMMIKGSRAQITFRQKYYSDQFHDDGIKTMSLRYESGGWKIKREDWEPLDSMEAKK